uniref:Uncharacterized protein n=1 Tax=Cyclopterus lumpus TaxID=8103 RepID=A0A8C2X0I3_CYCLU
MLHKKHKLNIKTLSLGAPRTAVYKFVKCNPEGDQANCVTQQSPKMAWSADLPAKLPASTAHYNVVEITPCFSNRLNQMTAVCVCDSAELSLHMIPGIITSPTETDLIVTLLSTIL